VKYQQATMELGFVSLIQVAHPDLVVLALEVFDKHMPQPNQLFVRRDDVVVTAADLVSTQGIDSKLITEEGLRNNINVTLMYMEAWYHSV
jgi:malate synthase